MRVWMRRLRMCVLTATCGSVFILGSCGLSDQQMTQIVQSVIQTGLNTIVVQLVNQWAGGPTS